MGRSGRHSDDRHHRHRRDRSDDDEEDSNRHRNKKESRRTSSGDNNEEEEDRRHRKEHRREDRHHREDDADGDDHDHEEKRRRRDPKKERRREGDDDDSHRRRHKKERRRDDTDDRKRDSERKKDRKQDHEKKRKKEKSKRRHDDDHDHDNHDDRKERKKHKSSKEKTSKPDKSVLHFMGDLLGRPPATLIDPEKDYFTFHQPFWVYLYREEGAAFNDLTSEEARDAFARFSKRYNAGDLEAPYYSTLPPEVLEECKTTKHAWSFQTSATERKGLEVLQQGVRRQTEYSSETKKAGSAKTGTVKAATASLPAPEDENDRFRRKTPQERLEERTANKRLKAHVRNTEEELRGGPKDARERQIEKRKEHSERIHGASKDKEAAGVELSDSAIYGQDQSLQTRLARERRNKAQRGDRQKNRIEELQNKERERQENMMKMLGLQALKPGQKITIAPRKDG